MLIWNSRALFFPAAFTNIILFLNYSNTEVEKWLIAFITYMKRLINNVKLQQHKGKKVTYFSWKDSLTMVLSCF